MFLTLFSTGGIEAKGKKITLKMTDPTDLSRDILTVSDYIK